MTEPEAYYWSAMAQLLPVLGLALVIEARTLTTRWGPAHSPRYRAVVTFFWAAGGVSMGWGTLIAVDALRANEAPTALQDQVVNAGIGLGVGLLLGSPLLDVLLTRGGVIGSVIALDPRPLSSTIRLRRKAQYLMRLIRRNRRFAYEGFTGLDVPLQEQRELLDRAERAGLDESDEAFAAVAESYELVSASRDALYRGWRESIVDEVNVANFIKLIRADLKSARAETMQQKQRELLAFADAWVSGGAVKKPVAERVFTDDGGFLTEGEPEPDALLPSDVNYIITDMEEFYRFSDDGKDM